MGSQLRTYKIANMAEEEPIRAPLPPFTLETALQKMYDWITTRSDDGSLQVQIAEDAWNTKDPEKVSKAYTKDSEWRNRDKFLNGREEIVQFLTEKWQKEKGYKLKKTLWCYRDNRIAVRFQYEWHDEQGQWYRAEGNEFDDRGYMEQRWASINDVPIKREERRIATE